MESNELLSALVATELIDDIKNPIIKNPLFHTISIT